jgi:hypothetical protein
MTLRNDAPLSPTIADLIAGIAATAKAEATRL